MLQPESTPGPAKGEVVEVFLGDTLEQAMAYAVASLGPDLAVRRARKVRKGVQGLVGRDRYEVLAAAGDPGPTGDVVGSAFDALLSQAEEAEEPTRVRRTTRPLIAASAPAPRVPTAPDRAREDAAPLILAAPVPSVPARAAGPAKPAARKPKPRTPASTSTAPAAPKAPRRREASSPPGPASGWSRATLRALGLPEAVLEALPEQDPTSDLAWAGALAEAIATVVPEPAPLSAATPLVVNGHGLAGVLGLLDAATRGYTPGTITSGDRTAPATATELALVVRTAVVG